MSENPRADYYLQCVAGGLALGLPINLRDFLDPWFAHETGGPFLKSSNAHHWFNNPCPWEHWERLRHSHFWVTREASVILEAGRLRDPKVRKRPTKDRAPDQERYRLMVDHAVPFEALKPILVAALKSVPQDRWIANLREVLLTYFRRGVLTKAEDDRLSVGVRAGEPLKSAMPSDWDRKDPFARYRVMGFERVAF